MMTVLQKLDAVLLFLTKVFDDKIDYKYGQDDDGRNWISVSPLEYEKHWKDDLQIVTNAFTEDENIQLKEIESTMEYLESEGLVISKKVNDYKKYSITIKGKVLAENGGFTGRKNREEIQYKLDVQQSELNALELFFKSKTFWIAAFGLAISIILAVHEIMKS